MHRLAVFVLLPIALQVNTAFAADYVVIPSGYENMPGNNYNGSPFGDGAQRFQMAIAASALGAIAPGTAITGIAFRLSGAAPVAPQTLTTFEVSLSVPANAPGSLSTTFSANRGADAVLTRSGPLTIAVADYPSGSSPNAFGRPIAFSTPYLYQGGNLLIEIATTSPSAIFYTDNLYPTPINAQSAYSSSFSATTADVGTYVDTIIMQLWTDDVFRGDFEPPAS